MAGRGVRRDSNGTQDVGALGEVRGRSRGDPRGAGR